MKFSIVDWILNVETSLSALFFFIPTGCDQTQNVNSYDEMQIIHKRYHTSNQVHKHFISNGRNYLQLDSFRIWDMRLWGY